MGYTHFFPVVGDTPTPEQWTEFVAEVASVLAKYEDILCREYDTPDEPPQVDSDIVLFNGKGDLGHETFVLRREETDSFCFCKTARKPYDAAVVEVLKCANRHFPGWLRLSSDGDGEHVSEDNPEGLVFH